MTKTQQCICFIVVLGTAGLALRGANVKERAEAPDLSHLTTATPAEQLAMAEAVYVHRQQDLDVLVGILNSEKTPNERKFVAAYILGQQRQIDAVDALVAHMLLHAPREEHSKLPLWDEYPAAEALARIGTPAVRPMLNNLSVSDDPKLRDLSARVIRVIEGKATAILILTNTAENETDSKRKERLLAALAEVKKD